MKLDVAIPQPKVDVSARLLKQSGFQNLVCVKRCRRVSGSIGDCP
jgi:hypothetical protein